MKQPPQDSEWIAMRRQHELECAAFTDKVNAEGRDLQRRADKEKVELLSRHSQQESDYWRRNDQKASNTSGSAPITPRLVAPKARSTASRSSATPLYKPRQGPLPTPNSARKQSLSKAFDSQKQDGKVAKSGSAIQQQRIKQAPTSSTGAQPPKPGQMQHKATTSRFNPTSKKESTIVDLCSSDDETLVEVTKPTYQQKAAPLSPSIPTATLQLFGENPQKPSSIPGSLSVKKEMSEVVRPALSQPLPCHSQLAQDRINRPPTVLLPAQHHDNNRDHHAAAFIAPKDKITRAPDNVLRPKVQETSKLVMDYAIIPINKTSSTLRQEQQTSGYFENALKNKQTKHCALGADDVLLREDSDNDFDMDDVPLVLLNIGAALKKLGTTATRSASMNVGSSTPEMASCSTAGARKAYLPSPSPSLASTPSTFTTLELTSLLNSFKKPTLPSTSRYPPYASARIVESRASSCKPTHTSALDRTTSVQRQASLASSTSNVTTWSKKRKQVDLSDDEPSDYSPSEASSIAARKKSIIPLGSPLKKPKAVTQSRAKRRGPPSPFASTFSPTGGNMNGFGYRTKVTPASSSTPATPPRGSTAKSKATTPVTPNQSSTDAREKALSTPPSKRKAADRAQSEIQKISEANKQFHTEDEIFRASAMESRQNDTSTAALGTRSRSMRITPIPTGTHFRASRGATTPDGHTRASDTSAAVTHKDGVCTRKSSLFPKDRATGNRSAARTRNIDKIVGDDSDEDCIEGLDISEFTYINGIIIRAGQEKRLAETQTKAAGDGGL